MTRFHFFTGSQSHGQHINLLCRAACWTSSGRQKLSRTSLPRARGGLSRRLPCPQPRPTAHPPGSHLHMISCVRSTRHISGFLSCPSYTIACGGQGTRESAQLPPRTAQHRGRSRRAGAPAAAGTPGTFLGLGGTEGRAQERRAGLGEESTGLGPGQAAGSSSSSSWTGCGAAAGAGRVGAYFPPSNLHF